MRWCEARGIPALTALVYGESGQPGPGLTTVRGDAYAAETEAVFSFNWFDVFPSIVQELAELSGGQSA